MLKHLSRAFAIVLLLAAPSLADLPKPDPQVEGAFHHLYSFDFPAAHRTLDTLLAERPSDPFAHALRAVTYLFSELDRMRILEAEFFQDDRRMKEAKKLKPDPEVREKLFAALDRAEALAEERLAKNPEDTYALFAMCAAKGVRVDYTGLVEKKLLGTVSLARESNDYALRLLAVEPRFYDAHLTVGFSEYLLGSLPFFVRWFVKFDGVEGKKENAFAKMELTAKNGIYLGPFARLLLAVFHLREKEYDRCREILAGLYSEYPRNPLIRRELAKLEQQLDERNLGR
jgi:hypothetical protein